MSAVIKVEDLSKQYRLGQVGTGSLSHDVNRWWHRMRGKEDPYLKIGEENDRTAKGNSDYVWALKDINFEVHQGEVLGIIGRNGAGKSTLLKILSKTTTPTTGQIKIKGRIASLLEVGTGFHPELSGRENIFLNGAILGMTKHEIKNKFDEIVDFAGVERYIDTPVKRYSSGMYVRLAFGVAAHLEPEILIVDEVLAVGDIEFQKKAMGKMKDVSEKDGKTVLFVSHNTEAVAKLSNKILVLENGGITFWGEKNKGLKHYLHSAEARIKSYKNPQGYFSKISIFSNAQANQFFIDQKIECKIQLRGLENQHQIVLSLDIIAETGIVVNSSRYYFNNNEKVSVLNLKCSVPADFLNVGEYFISAFLTGDSNQSLESLTEVISFQTVEERNEMYLGKINGVVRFPLLWERDDIAS